MKEVQGNNSELIEEAHRLKGSVGIVGLQRISDQAGLIEDQATFSADVAKLIDELFVIILESAREFERRNMSR
jgi:HPt (histidine-containing phosphotransfer) domain-containing protein